MIKKSKTHHGLQQSSPKLLNWWLLAWEILDDHRDCQGDECSRRSGGKTVVQGTFPWRHQRQNCPDVACGSERWPNSVRWCGSENAPVRRQVEYCSFLR